MTEWDTTWARTIGLFDETSGPTAVSRTWKRLEDARLIHRERGEGRKARIRVLREDGSGKKYTHPHKTDELYFRLPFEYWTAPARWHDSLTMTAKVMLLVTTQPAAKRIFFLPQERIQDWYEISADTSGRGLAELKERGLLHVVRQELFPILHSETGYSARNIYRLMEPVDLKSRGTGCGAVVKRRAGDHHGSDIVPPVRRVAQCRYRCSRVMSILDASSHPVALASILIYGFVAWWRDHVHRQNVDRVCTSLEGQAQAGHPVADVGKALALVRLMSPLKIWPER